jgi:8-oxo-dGTP pyrophosphatase MutT (NUDIX family)
MASPPKKKAAKSRKGPGKPRKARRRVQYAALPFRFAPGLEIMLVTSRETGRWVIPKGWPMPGKSPSQAAAREALEEAGVTGKITRPSIGVYEYDKLVRGAPAIPCRVRVFALAVKEQRANWPERAERTTAWFSCEDAAAAVAEQGLADIIRGFAAARLEAAPRS